MKLEEAKQKAVNMLDYLKPYVKRIEVVGSIRRECEDVNDIDIILIPNEKFTMDFVNSLNPIKKGEKLIMFELQSIQYDLYICNEENWEVIKLIRTGSKEHNKKLCFFAIKKGMSLKAGGEGLVKSSIVISNTERGILENLLNKYIEPKGRI
jgi:DNA polymerase/3'-5' exonuclease PolX